MTKRSATPLTTRGLRICRSTIEDHESCIGTSGDTVMSRLEPFWDWYARLLGNFIRENIAHNSRDVANVILGYEHGDTIDTPYASSRRISVDRLDGQHTLDATVHEYLPSQVIKLLRGPGLEILAV